MRQKTEISESREYFGTNEPSGGEASASDTVSSANVFAVFPKKTYKTVSVYTLGDRPARDLEMALRERRDLASRVPSISIERQRERMELDRLRERVESVLKLEEKLAGIADKYDDREAEGGRILGSLVQTLVLVRNTNLLPVLLTKWAGELEMVLGQVNEETLSDLLLWSTVLHWWEQTVDGGGKKTCVELVYGANKVEVQKGHLARFVKQSARTDKVRSVLEEGGWAKREVWESMDRALVPRSKAGISKNLPFLENLFLLEETGLSEEASVEDICNICEQLLNLNSHPEGSVLADVQDLFKLFKVHLHFALDGLPGDQLKVMSSKLESLSGVTVAEKDLVTSVAALLTSTMGAEEFEEDPEVVAVLLLQTSCYRETGLLQIDEQLFNILQTRLTFQCKMFQIK